MERVVEIRLKATDEVVGTAKNKGEAEKLAKKLMLTAFYERTQYFHKGI